MNVQGVAAERLGRPARPEVLEEIARVTRGQVVKADKLDEIVQSLAELPEPPPMVRRVQLWCHPAVAGTLVGRPRPVLGGAEMDRPDLMLSSDSGEKWPNVNFRLDRS